MARSIDWTRQARSDVKKLSKQDADRVTRALHRLAASGRGNVERLKGFAPPLYRLSVRSWRVAVRYEEIGAQGNCLSVQSVLSRWEKYRGPEGAHHEIPRGECLSESGVWDTQGSIGG